MLANGCARRANDLSLLYTIILYRRPNDRGRAPSLSFSHLFGILVCFYFGSHPALDSATSESNDKGKDGIPAELISGNRPIEPHALPSAPPVDRKSVAAARSWAETGGEPVDTLPQFVSEREELGSATTAAAAAAVVGVALDNSETVRWRGGENTVLVLR